MSPDVYYSLEPTHLHQRRACQSSIPSTMTSPLRIYMIATDGGVSRKQGDIGVRGCSFLLAKCSNPGVALSPDSAQIWPGVQPSPRRAMLSDEIRAHLKIRPGNNSPAWVLRPGDTSAEAGSGSSEFRPEQSRLVYYLANRKQPPTWGSDPSSMREAISTRKPSTWPRRTRTDRSRGMM